MSAEVFKADNFSIDCDFPGGNIVVDAVEDNVVYLHQDLRDTDGTWFYWYFRIRGAQGKTLTFKFTKNDVLSPIGPAFSLDSGQTWQWLGKESCHASSFVFSFEPDYREVRFCVAVPYLQTNLESLLENHWDNPHLKKGVLCKSNKQRDVELLELGCLDKQPRHRVLLTSRHHCCETMASFVLEGILEGIMADNAIGYWLRENVHFLVVPFMDKDGCEDGDQGKNRRPHDHNRDYGKNSIYPSVRALKEMIPSWSQGLLHVALDLHCPELKGEYAEYIYSPGSADPITWSRQQQFSDIIERINDGPLPFKAANNLPHGVGWNTRQPRADVKSFAEWARALEEVYLAMTIETPYAWASQVAVTADSARSFGHSLAKALQILLLDQIYSAQKK